MRTCTIVWGLTLVGGLANIATGPAWCQEGNSAELAKAIGEAKVSLDQGISAGARAGKPISAKFEIEEGKPQLSVYAAKGDVFSETIIDHNTGKVIKSEPITSGDDLAAAKEQSQAISKARQSLRSTIAKVLKGNPGFRAVSIVPAVKDGHPVAELTLVAGDQWKNVSVKLD